MNEYFMLTKLSEVCIYIRRNKIKKKTKTNGTFLQKINYLDDSFNIY